MKNYKDQVEQAAIEEEERRKAEESLIDKLKHGHKKPVSRRDFLAHGLLAGGATMVMPSILDLVVGSKKAYGLPDHVPALVIDIAGGASIASFFPAQGQAASIADGFVPGQADLLAAHDKMGPALTIANGDVDLRFGAPIRRADPAYNPFITNATAAALNGVSAITACGIAKDDTQENPFGVQTLIARMNSIFGHKLPILSTGHSNLTVSGGYSSALLGVQPNHRGLFMPNLNTVGEALSLGSPLLGASTPSQRRSLLKALVDMSAAQIKQAHGQHFLETLKDLASSGFPAAEELANANLSVDPRANIAANTIYRQVFGIDENSAANNGDVLRAAALKAAFEGLSPTVVFTRAGGDYHTRRLAGFNAVHADIGQWTGQAIRVAHALGRKIVIFWITDGGMVWGNNSVAADGDLGHVPFSDRGEATQLAMFQYNPEHLSLSSPQINFSSLNYFNAGQGANRNDLVAPSPRRLALAMVYNYAIVAGLTDRFLQEVPDSEFPHGQLSRYEAFKG